MNEKQKREGDELKALGGSQEKHSSIGAWMFPRKLLEKVVGLRVIILEMILKPGKIHYLLIVLMVKKHFPLKRTEKVLFVLNWV